ncbi:MAG: winged helix-turn-helix transcriptional regulator [Roseovarius sp.]|nr:winged helix-turn-helix transcriptional regulator [Roseovarius sp.]
MAAATSPEAQPSEGDPLCLDRQLCFALYAASNLMVRAYRPLLAPLGLTYAQYLVMLVLWREGAIGVGDLCRRLFLDSGTVTPLLKRMEKAGLVQRRRDDRDERRVVVTPTPHGMALRDRATTIPDTLARRLAGHLTVAEAEGLRTTMRRLVAVLADGVSGPAAPGAKAPEVPDPFPPTP